MNPEARRKYNDSFSEETYANLVNEIAGQYPGQLDFRVAESPVFIPKDLGDKIKNACEDIIATLLSTEFKKKTDAAIPDKNKVPNENDHTSFLAIDFAICKESDGTMIPKLIELQGFPSVFAYQPFLSEQYQKHFEIDANYRYTTENNASDYYDRLRSLILGSHKPEQVILMEIYPEKQKTRIDFAITEEKLGVKAVCYTKIRKEGRKLYYENKGLKIEIKRIYNRLIFDELDAYPDLKTDFHYTDDVDVEWVGHPNWFFRISKFTLPFLDNDYVPETRFLSDYKGNYPENLNDFVLKPLFSFAGSGVLLHVTPGILESLSNPEHYILQQKVTYEPVIESPDGLIKCEIRMMYIWPDDLPRPELLISLSRLSRGEMIGVNFNKDFSWVGSSACFFEDI